MSRSYARWDASAALLSQSQPKNEKSIISQKSSMIITGTDTDDTLLGPVTNQVQGDRNLLLEINDKLNNISKTICSIVVRLAAVEATLNGQSHQMNELTQDLSTCIGGLRQTVETLTVRALDANVDTSDCDN